MQGKTSDKHEPVSVCPCSFRSLKEKRESRKAFIRQYGEALPEDEIEKAVVGEVWDQWVEYCNCEDKAEIVAGIHYENNDWYLCTLKGLAVKKDWRERGLGKAVTKEGVEKASQNPDCKVLAADITFDNKPSLRCLEAAGFEIVGEFCWKKGEKPADILHMVRFKPTRDKTCLEP